MSEQDISEAFDGPIVEPIKGIGDVKFDRASMDYWATWASALKQKRTQNFNREIDQIAGIDPIAKAKAKAAAQNVGIQIFEVLDMQYVPEGIDKITKDAFQRAGGDLSQWPSIRKRIGPRRLQSLASEICSEPCPTSDELREALRNLIKKAQKAPPPNIETMSDEELIESAKQFQPVAEAKAGDNPLSDRPASESGPESTGEAEAP